LLQLPSASSTAAMASRALNLFTICRRQFAPPAPSPPGWRAWRQRRHRQPLSLLLKQSPLVSQLALYDIQGVKGVAADLSHISTKAELLSSRRGVPRKPGMTRDDLFNTNAGIVADLITAVAKTCPKAMICIVTNPVPNSTVPIAAEILKKHNAYDPRRLFWSHHAGHCAIQTHLWPRPRGWTCPSVPVIGGHSGVTIIPVISQAVPSVSFKAQDRETLTTRIQNAGTEAGAGSATLSMAFAAEKFVDSVLQAIDGKRGVIECAFVESTVTEAPYFSTPLLLGRDGVEENLGLGNLIEFEAKLLQAAMPELQQKHRQGREVREGALLIARDEVQICDCRWIILEYL
uniref:Malate dehydrogenase, mitochondrial n=1 Tax=Macrostomum lignano TaxID=282301 RepID=A0A1I8FTB0_9PLAT